MFCGTWQKRRAVISGLITVTFYLFIDRYHNEKLSYPIACTCILLVFILAYYLRYYHYGNGSSKCMLYLWIG